MKRIAAALFAALVVLAGCSSDDDAQGTTDDEYIPDPNDTHDPTKIDFTSTITITDTGFQPLKATAVFGETLTFVNETSVPQTIQFTNGALNIDGPSTIGPIPPGESMSYQEPLDAAASLVYESDGLPGQTGQLQVDPGIDTL